MATKRKIYRFRHGEIIDVEEFHDGQYGAAGKKRQKKKRPSTEQIQLINRLNKTRRCRHKLLEYFLFGDYFVTWTYRKEERPENMKAALKDFQQAMRYVRKEYKKRGHEVRWIRNIEQGTRGAWHIHLVINRVPGTADILEEAWRHGGSYTIQIKKSSYFDEDFSRLANYMTKDGTATEKRKDGTLGKPKIKEASYGTSRNMPLHEPYVDKLIRWKKEVRPKKGYYIAKIYDGVNPITGYKYRRYTMIRLNRGRRIYDYNVGRYKIGPIGAATHTRPPQTKLCSKLPFTY